MQTSRRPRRSPRALAVAAGILAVGIVSVLAGCANTVGMTAAPSANETACAAVQVRLPATVSPTLALQETDAQSTAAWGTPSAVLYRCGVAVPTVSDLPCVSKGPVDWIRDDRRDDGQDTVVYTTFGRDPAVQVVIDTTKATDQVLQDVGDAVATLPRDGHRCLDPSDVPTS